MMRVGSLIVSASAESCRASVCVDVRGCRIEELQRAPQSHVISLPPSELDGKMLKRRRVIVVLCVAVFVAIAAFAWREFAWRSDWAMIQRAARLQAMQGTTDVNLVTGPHWYEPLWAVARFRIPVNQVAEFVEKNGCEPSDRLEFKRYRRKLPRETQALPETGAHYYHSGETTTGKPFELLVHSQGLVILYVMLDD